MAKKKKPETPAPKNEVARTDKGHFKKGVSGNPGGRPPTEHSFRQGLRDEGLRKKQIVVNGKKRFLTKNEIAAVALWNSALYQHVDKKTGRKEWRVNLAALAMLMNRTDGLPIQEVIQHTGDESPYIMIVDQDFDE